MLYVVLPTWRSLNWTYSTCLLLDGLLSLSSSFHAIYFGTIITTVFHNEPTRRSQIPAYTWTTRSHGRAKTLFVWWSKTQPKKSKLRCKDQFIIIRLYCNSQILPRSAGGGEDGERDCGGDCHPAAAGLPPRRAQPDLPRPASLSRRGRQQHRPRVLLALLPAEYNAEVGVSCIGVGDAVLKGVLTYVSLLYLACLSSKAMDVPKRILPNLWWKSYFTDGCIFIFSLVETEFPGCEYSQYCVWFLSLAVMDILVVEETMSLT